MDKDKKETDHSYIVLPSGDDDAACDEKDEHIEQAKGSSFWIRFSYLPGLFSGGGQNGSDRFEHPDYKSLMLYTICCATIYPLFYLLCRAAAGRSLFEVRALVGAGSSIVSIVLGIFLKEYAQKLTESAAWTTLIQQNDVKQEDRLSLSELNDLSSSPTSLLAPPRMITYRRRLHKSLPPNAGSYRHRLWYTYLVFFFVVVAAVNLLDFLMGRIVDITAQTSFDFGAYDEVPVFGDLSTEDEASYIPFDLYDNKMGTSIELSGKVRAEDWDSMPSSWRYNTPSYFVANYKNQSMYFAEPYYAQLRSDGIGLGSSYATAYNVTSHTRRASDVISNPEVHASHLLQYPQWGVRVACERLADVNGYMYTPQQDGGMLIHLQRDFLVALYGRLNLTFVEETFRGILPPAQTFAARKDEANPDAAIGPTTEVRDPTFGEENVMSIYFQRNGTTFDARRIAGIFHDRGNSGSGWTMFDVFVRTLMWEEGSLRWFPVYFEIEQQYFGVDAIACLQRVEPWLIEVYNSSGIISATRIVEGVASLDDLTGDNAKRKSAVSGNVVRRIDSRHKVSAFWASYSQTTRKWFAQLGTLNIPSQLDVSWTNGLGPYNYTFLDTSLFETFRATTIASTMLPLLAGSQQIAARRFDEKQVAFADIMPFWMSGAIVALYVAGLIGCLCIPRLPCGRPQRGFNLFSWLAAVRGDSFDVDRSTSAVEDQGPFWRAGMTVKEVEDDFGSMKVNYSGARA